MVGTKAAPEPLSRFFDLNKLETGNQKNGFHGRKAMMQAHLSPLRNYMF
jgi:hypothetical protein